MPLNKRGEPGVAADQRPPGRKQIILCSICSNGRNKVFWLGVPVVPGSWALVLVNLALGLGPAMSDPRLGHGNLKTVGMCISGLPPTSLGVRTTKLHDYPGGRAISGRCTQSTARRPQWQPTRTKRLQVWLCETARTCGSSTLARNA